MEFRFKDPTMPFEERKQDDGDWKPVEELRTQVPWLGDFIARVPALDIWEGPMKARVGSAFAFPRREECENFFETFFKEKGIGQDDVVYLVKESGEVVTELHETVYDLGGIVAPTGYIFSGNERVTQEVIPEGKYKDWERARFLVVKKIDYGKQLWECDLAIYPITPGA